MLFTVSRNFGLYSNDPSICLLSVEDFKVILKHKRLQVYHEDEVVRAFYLWHLGSKVSNMQISQILNDINWNYVSTPCLL